MPISRRQLLAGATGLAALHALRDTAAAETAEATAPATPAPAAAHPEDKTLPPVPLDEPIDGPVYLKCGPMIGHTTQDRALLWAKASNAAKLTVRISTDAGLANARIVQGPALTADTAFAGTVEITDLQPATRYYYSVLLDGEPVSPRPYPSFHTTVAPGTPGKMRFAFVSCVGDRDYHAAAAWGELAARRNIDLLLMLGDNHYANSTDLQKQRAYYLMHRSVGGFQALTAQVPCYAVWDDHDFGHNDSDTTEPNKETSLRAFKEWWANPSYGEENVPGVYFKFSRGDVDFFMLDVRYHRSPDKAEKNDQKTMLGDAQFAWLKRELKASKAKLKFIASGSVFDSKGSLDSWALYPHARRALLDFLREEVGDGVILISGDRHFSAGYQVEGRFIEITSGPMGSSNATATVTDELWLSCSTGRMWSIFEVDTTKPEPAVAYELWMAGQGRLERRELTWEQVNGRAKIPPSPALPRVPALKKPAPTSSAPAQPS